MSDEDTPTYVGRCPVCERLIAAAVADVNQPETLLTALNHRSDWAASGLLVETVTVIQARTESWGHMPDCERLGYVLELPQ